MDHDAEQGLHEGFLYESYAIQKPQDRLFLYEAESQILALYDQLVQSRLEKALLEAAIESSSESLHEEEVESKLKTAERLCLETRAAYLLKDKIVESIVSVDPTLKAIHSGACAAPSERFSPPTPVVLVVALKTSRMLYPILNRRDVLGIAQTNLSAGLNSTLKALTMAEAENIGALEKNRKLTKSLLGLISQLKSQQDAALHKARSGVRLDKLKDGTRTAERRWKIMQSFVSAVIVGSGVDWARSEELTQAVIHEEN